MVVHSFDMARGVSVRGLRASERGENGGAAVNDRDGGTDGQDCSLPPWINCVAVL